MSVDEAVLEFMKKLDLSDDEVKVYLAVLGGGRLALGDASSLTGLSMDVCRGVLDRLVELRFVRRVPGEVEGFVALNPFLAGFLIVYEDLDTFLAGLRDVLGSRCEEVYGRLDEGKNSSVEEISRLTLMRVDNLRSFVDEFTGLLGSRFEGSADSFRGLSVSVEEAIHSLLSTSMIGMGDVEHFEEKKSFSLSDVTSEFISNVEADIGSLEDLSSKTFSSFIEEIRKRFELIKLRFASVLFNHHSQHEKLNYDLDNKVRLILEEDLRALKSLVGLVESSVFEILRVILEIAGERVESFKARYLETLDGLLNEYLDVLTSFEPRVKSILEGLESVSFDLARSTSVLASRRKAFTNVVLKGDTFFEELNNQTRDIYERAKSLIADYQGVVSDQIVSAQEITDLISKSFSTFVDEKTNIIRGEVEKVEQKFKEGITPKSSLIESKISDNISEAIKTSKDDCEKMCIQLEQEIGNYIDHAFKNVMDALSSFESGSKELFSTHNDNIRNKVKLLEYSVLYLRKKLAQMLQNNAFEYDKMTDELYDNLSNSIKQKIGPYLEELSPFEEKITSIISESYRESRNAIDNDVRDINERTANIASQIESKEELLRKIWETSYSFIDQDVKTWSLRGEKAIIAHAKSMVGRTKKNIMIISPALNPEILEELLNITRFKATIVSDIDLKVFESVIKHFSRQGNVKFLNYPHRDLWCVVRDNDEVLFAPVTPKEETVAMVSEQQGYIKFCQELATPRVLSKSKEIKLS
ncbi:MAG: hypothetical protein ACETWM_18540 [Candidatus Lokiarchaeia archaeon]